MDIRYPIIFALLGLLIIPIASATDGNSTLNQQLLSDALAQASCKTNFMNGVISSIVTNVPSASSLSQYSNTLTSDYQTLQGYAGSGDSTDYVQFVHGTYDPDVKSASAAIEQWRSDNGKNLTNDTRSTIKADYDQLSSTYQGCEYSALQQYANDKLSIYSSDLSNYQNNISSLSAKGVPTGDLSSLMSQAQSEVISPLQSAVASSTNSSQLRMALTQYCLYNGCDNGTNFHLAAKFDSDKLGDVLTYIQPMANTAGLGSNVTSAQTQLSSVQSELSTVGTSVYSSGQQQEVWSGLEGVASQVKDIISSIRSSHT